MAIINPRPCIRCATVFVPLYRSTRYCTPACRAAGKAEHKARRRAYYKQYYQDNREKRLAQFRERHRNNWKAYKRKQMTKDMALVEKVSDLWNVDRATARQWIEQGTFPK